MELNIEAAAGAASQCVYCREELGELPLWRCAECAVTLHRACHGELGRCPTLGCVGAEAPAKAPEPVAVTLARPQHDNVLAEPKILFAVLLLAFGLVSSVVLEFAAPGLAQRNGARFLLILLFMMFVPPGIIVALVRRRGRRAEPGVTPRRKGKP